MADKSPALPDSRGALSGYAHNYSNNRAKVNPSWQQAKGWRLFG
jgi:hypothetical protein